MSSKMHKRIHINMTTESFDNEYMKAIRDPWERKASIGELNENLRRPMLHHHTIVEMYNDAVQQLYDAKELVYQLTLERMSHDPEAWKDE